MTVLATPYFRIAVPTKIGAAVAYKRFIAPLLNCFTNETDVIKQT